MGKRIKLKAGEFVADAAPSPEFTAATAPESRQATFEAALPSALAGDMPRVIASGPGEELTAEQGGKLARYNRRALDERHAANVERAGGTALGTMASATSGLPIVGGLAPLLSSAADAATSGRTFGESRKLMGDQYRAAQEEYLLAHLAPMVMPLGPLTSTPARVAATFGADALLRSSAGNVMAAPEQTIGGAFKPTPEGLASVLRDTAASAGTAGIASAIGSRLIGGAPERVAARTVKDITVGEATAKLSTAKDVIRAAGEDGVRLQAVAAEVPGLERDLAVKAHGQPAKIATRVKAQVDADNAIVKEQMAAIDAGTGGGEQAYAVRNRMVKLRGELVAQGRLKGAKAVDDSINALTREYADARGRIPPTVRIPMESIRNMRNEIGEEVFTQGFDPSKIRASSGAKLTVYRTFNRIIEDNAKRAGAKAAGADYDAIAGANRRMSTLIPMLDSLRERGIKEAGGRISLTAATENMAAAGLAAGAGDSGAIARLGKYALASTGLPLLKKGGGRVVREVDYSLAQLVRAARNGSTAAQLTAKAIELGVSPAIAAQIGRNLTQATGEQLGEMAGPEAP